MALLVFPLSSVAQPVRYWSTVDPRPDNLFMSANSAAFNGNGEGFVFGETEDYDEQFAQIINPNGVRLTKFSSNGEVLWHVQVPHAETGYGVDSALVRVTSDGGAITYTGWSTGSPSTEQRLTRYSSNGQTLWTKSVGLSNFAVASDDSVLLCTGDNGEGEVWVDKINSQGIETKVGGLSVVGASLDALVQDGSGGAWSAGHVSRNSGGVPAWDLLLVHFNANGTVQSWTYSGLNFFRVFDILLDPSGNLVLGGLSPFGAQTPPFTTLAKLDPTGTLLWSQVFPDGVDTIVPDRVDAIASPLFRLDPSRNVLYAYNSATSHRPVVDKVSSSGQTLWSKTFDPNVVSQRITDLLVDPAGNAFALFSTYQTIQRNGNYNYNLVKYLSNGDLGWPGLANGDLVYDGSPDDQPAGLERDRSGNLYIGGISEDGTGREGQHAIKYGAANNAAFMSQTVVASMVAGQTYSVSETFSNTGVNSWTMAGGYFLRTSNPTDNLTWGINKVNLSATESILAGQGKTFRFAVYAPMTPGNYNLQWRMAQGTGSFGNASVNLAIAVVEKQQAARYISQSIPNTVKAGSTFSVSVTMRNVGSLTWTKTAGFALGSIEPSLNTVWGSSTIPLGAGDTIASGANKPFTFICKAPSTPGTYTMRWQMHRQASSYSGFFGDFSPRTTIVVTP